MIDVELKNPVFVTEDLSVIDVILTHPVYGEIPFSASKNDVEPYGREIYHYIFDGNIGEIGEYVTPIKEAEEVNNSAAAIVIEEF